MPFVVCAFTGTATTTLQTHTPEGTGDTWTRHTSGAADIIFSNANRIRGNTGTGAPYHASGTPAAAEYDVQGDVVVFSVIGGSSGIGIAGRMSTSALTFYMARYAPSAGAWQLYKCVTGTFTLLGSYTQTLTATNTYVLKLEIRDAAKKLFVDGVERISSADNAITAAGLAGLRFSESNSDTTGLHLDNFSATDAGGGGTAHTGAATVAGVSTVTAAATSAKEGAATVAAVSSVSVAGSAVHAATASIDGVSSVSAAAASVHAASATIAGVSSVTTDATSVKEGAATVASASSVTADSTAVHAASATIAAVSSVTAAAVTSGSGTDHTAAATIAAVSTVTSAADHAAFAEAMVAATSSVTATAQTTSGTAHTAAATITSTSTVTSSAEHGAFAAAMVTAVSSVTATADVSSGGIAHTAAAAIAGVSSVTASATANHAATASVASVSSVTATAVRVSAVVSPTPDDRTYRVTVSARSQDIAAGGRTYRVPVRNRT